MVSHEISSDAVSQHQDIGKAERVLSAEEVEFAKDHQNYDRLDKELAKYVSDARIEISPEKNIELRRKIDKRILTVMVCTYFLQAIDKGTLSFASIMGIREDTNLVGQEYSWLTTCIYITILVVEYPQNWIIARYAGCLLLAIPLSNTILTLSKGAPRQIPRLQYCRLGRCPSLHRRLHQLCWSRRCADAAGSVRIGMPAGLCASLLHLVSKRRAGI